MNYKKLFESPREIANNISEKRCSCYDDECKDVIDHFGCFVGDDNTGGVTDGYCPWLR